MIYGIPARAKNLVNKNQQFSLKKITYFSTNKLYAKKKKFVFMIYYEFYKTFISYKKNLYVFLSLQETYAQYLTQNTL